MKGLGGFRNVLVHDDLGVDHDRVFDLLQRLDDLEALARALDARAAR